MTSLSGQFQTELSIDDAMVACSEAIDGLGWHIETVEGDQIVAFTESDLEDPARIEVGLSESGNGTEFRIIGSDSEEDPLEQDELIAVLDRARDAIHRSMEGFEKKEQVKEPPPTDERQRDEEGSGPGEPGGDPGAAAGWYPDVHDDSRERYWDGKRWTDAFRPIEGESKPAPSKPNRSGRKQARAEKRRRSRERGEQRRRERQQAESAPASDARPEEEGAAAAMPAKFRSLQLIATIYGALAWLVAVLGPIGVIAAAASADRSDLAVTLIGGLLGVAFYVLLLFGISAAIRLALAVEENTRNTVELLKARNDLA